MIDLIYKSMSWITATYCCLLFSFLPAVVYSDDLDLSPEHQKNQHIDIPTVIPGVVPKTIDLMKRGEMPASGASEHSPRLINLDRQVESYSNQSNLIIHGRISEVEYQTAQADSGGKRCSADLYKCFDFSSIAREL